MKLRVLCVAVIVVVASAGCGGGDSDRESGGASGAQAEVDESVGSDDDLDEVELDVDNCTLLTDEEVSALAGKELESDLDSALGCAWVVPGEVVGDFTLDSFRSATSAADYGAALVPSADVIPIDGVGDEAVALAVDGSVNFVVAKQGDLGVVLVTTFLDVTPDSPSLEAAGDLAATALGRLADAA